MKKLLLILALIIPVLASAEPLPPGCYVADWGRTSPCWYPSDQQTEWIVSNDWISDSMYYGYPMATVLESEYAYKNGFLALQSLPAQIKTQNKLIKKLRSACGSKCRKIK